MTITPQQILSIKLDETKYFYADISVKRTSQWFIVSALQSTWDKAGSVVARYNTGCNYFTDSEDRAADMVNFLIKASK